MNTHIPGCVSCDVLAGRIKQPGGTIYEDPYWSVTTILPPIIWRGFLIIKLKRHCEHVAELTPQEASALGMVIQIASQALMDIIRPAKIFVCSFGDGVKHIHFWLLPRPPGMRAGMHPVMFQLDLRMYLTRRFGLKRWIVPESAVEATAAALRERMQIIRAGILETNPQE